jgi:hypothetical protein
MEGQKTNPLAQALSPSAILGAFGFLSFSRDVISWQQDLLTWLDAWRAFTHLVTDYLFGWIPPLINLPFPGWAHDYLALSVIIFGATTRSILFRYREFSRNPERYGRQDGLFSSLMRGLIGSLIWPIQFLFQLLSLYYFITTKDNVEKIDYNSLPPPTNRLQLIQQQVDSSMWIRKNSTVMFFSSFVWAAIIIAINYTLLFAQ